MYISIHPYIHTYVHTYIHAEARLIIAENGIGGGVRHHPNKCPEYDTEPSDGEAGDLGNVEYLFIIITPRSTMTLSVWVPSIVQRGMFNYLTVCKKMIVKLNC